MEKSQKKQLLADIAFSPSAMSPATAIQIANSSIAIIEEPGFMPRKVEMLSSALNGITRQSVGPVLLEHVKSWAPQAIAYADNLFNELENWPATPDLLEKLKQALYGNARFGGYAVASALGRTFRGNQEPKEWLLKCLNGNADIESTAMILAALVYGWPEAAELTAIVDDARASLSSSLRAVAIWARVKLNRQTDEDLLEILDLHDDQSDLPYREIALADEALLKGWPNHPLVIDMFLKGPRPVRTRIGADYLLNCFPKNTRICGWIVEELSSEYPFSMDHQSWDRLLPFATSNAQVYEALVTAITTKDEIHWAYKYENVLATVLDPRLKFYALKKVKEVGADWSRSWYLRALLKGWSRDPDVLALIQEIRNWPEESLLDIVTSVPQLWPDKASSKPLLLKLLNLAKRYHLHLYPALFAEIGCNEFDDDVVESLLESLKSASLGADEGSSLIRNFSAHPLVQSFARESLLHRSPPLAAIAATYSTVPDIRVSLLNRIGALPLSLRYLIADVASLESDANPVMEGVLNQYDWEVDVDLKTLLSIRKHEIVIASPQKNIAIAHLLEDVRAVGTDYEDRRAAAAAGLIVLGAMDKFTSLKDGEKPLNIHLGGHSTDSPALLELIAQKWDYLIGQFGEDLTERIGHFSSSENTWELLAPYISWHDGMKRQFLNFCENTTHSLGLKGLSAFAKERPGTESLKRLCLLAIDSLNNINRSALMAHETAFKASSILHDQFSSDPDVGSRLEKIFDDFPRANNAMLLAIYDAKHPIFDRIKIGPLAVGQKGDWALACTLSASRDDTAHFKEVVCEMLNRKKHNFWDFQQHINTAVLTRLSIDRDMHKRFEDVISKKPTNNELGTLPRYLSSIAAFDQNTLLFLREKLDFFSSKKGVAAVGFDAITNDFRPVSHSLMDIFQ